MKAEVAKLIQEREDAAEREENPDKEISDENLDETANMDTSTTPTKDEPDFGATEDDLDEDRPAKHLADSIQQTLNEEIKAEFD